MQKLRAVRVQLEPSTCEQLAPSSRAETSLATAAGGGEFFRRRQINSVFASEAIIFIVESRSDSLVWTIRGRFFGGGFVFGEEGCVGALRVPFTGFVWRRIYLFAGNTWHTIKRFFYFFKVLHCLIKSRKNIFPLLLLVFGK